MDVGEKLSIQEAPSVGLPELTATRAPWEIEQEQGGLESSYLFGATIFLSALLLFSIQPLFSKMVLPVLGGSPNVWTTAMLFFQTILLLGYAYAHLTTRVFGLKAQLSLHVSLMLAAALFLPIALQPGWSPPEDGTPIFWLISYFGVCIGLPFFAISANAPLLQSWYVSAAKQTDENDPYFLYSASNAGSILALLSFPFFLEPTLRLSQQSTAWSAGYAVLLVGLIACGYAAIRNASLNSKEGKSHAVSKAPTSLAPSFGQRLTWIGYAFVPSTLLLSVTTHITTDIAVAPLFWVIPLALYLLTFVISFAQREFVSHDLICRIQTPLLILSAMSFIWGSNASSFVVVLYLLTLFFSGLVCHGQLARTRPDADRLTEFYFWLSFGGVLGGFFNAVIAPLAFNAILEFPIAIILASLARPILAAPTSKTGKGTVGDIFLPMLLFTILIIPRTVFGLTTEEMGTYGLAVICVFIAIALLNFSSRPSRFAVGAAAVLVAAPNMDKDQTVLWQDRSFFGVYSVSLDATTGAHILKHGTTVHGVQLLDKENERRPLAYYHPNGPLGQAFDTVREFGATRNVGIVGLGVGATACYARDGEDWRFFEIDPVVTNIARNKNLFTFLPNCAPKANIVNGDARQTLALVPPSHFDFLLIDAFSSDAIPVHLMTDEAISLYASTLAKEGLLMLHISNRHLELAPILGNIAYRQGLEVAHTRFIPENRSESGFVLSASEWVIMSKSEEIIQRFIETDEWNAMTIDPGRATWTDDYSDIVGTFK